MRLPFELDPQIIHHIIYSQAGSIGKAIIELIMNAEDSGSTRATLTISQHGFSIADDGAGFTSEENVRRYFGRFGTPHTDGDATFGRFRLGRGQVMAHASTIWRSNHWQMAVDTREMGYSYDLSGLEEPVQGCSIEGAWYEPLDAVELLSAVQEVRDLVRYTSMQVELNGKVITRNPAAETWDLQDELAYYRVKAEGSVAIYNQGVLVRHDAAHIWGVGGLIVTKKAIGLNVSRTEILRKTCSAWKHIASKFKRLADKFQAENDHRRKTEARRERFAKALLAGDPDIWRIFHDEEVITMLPGARHVSAHRFLHHFGRQGKTVAIVEHASQVGRAESIAYATSDVVFVHPKTLDRFGCGSAGEFKEMLDRVFENMFEMAQPAQWRVDHCAGGREAVIQQTCQHPRYADFDLIERKFASRMEVIPDKAIADINTRGAWIALRWCLHNYANVAHGGNLRRSGRASLDRNGKRMDILLGRSNTADAWTDGESYIAFNIKLVQTLRTDGLKAISRIFTVMDHELAHEGDSIGAAHDEVFYERFHAISQEMAWYRQLYMDTWLRKYTRSMEYRGKGSGRFDREAALISRAGKGRRKDGLPPLVDAQDDPARAEATPEVPEATYALINASLVAAGHCPPPPNWAELLREAEVEFSRRQEQDAAARIAEEEEDCRRQAKRAETLAKIRAQLVEKYGAEAATLEDSDVDYYFANVTPGVEWDGAWAEIKYYRLCGRIYRRIKIDPESYLETVSILNLLKDKPEEEWPALWEANKEKFFDDWAAENSEPPADEGEPEDAELLVRFMEVCGRDPESGKELQQWAWADFPKLEPGETMWQLQRNANAAGFWSVSEYLGWRAECGQNETRV